MLSALQSQFRQFEMGIGCSKHKDNVHCTVLDHLLH